MNMLYPIINGSGVGEKNPGDMGCKLHGAGDSIPGTLPNSTSVLVWRRSPKKLLLLLLSVKMLAVISLSLAGLVFSMEANLAAGEMSPGPAAEEEAPSSALLPVRRCTRSMKSLTVVWMTLGETE